MVSVALGAESYGTFESVWLRISMRKRSHGLLDYVVTVLIRAMGMRKSGSKWTFVTVAPSALVLRFPPVQ